MILDTETIFKNISKTVIVCSKIVGKAKRHLHFHSLYIYLVQSRLINFQRDFTHLIKYTQYIRNFGHGKLFF